jgi:hypothetical protein
MSHYITLEPDLSIGNNTLSDFVSILTEPLILEGAYQLALTDFFSHTIFPFW